jgi:hypothetical protein
MPFIPATGPLSDRDARNERDAQLGDRARLFGGRNDGHDAQATLSG